MPFRPLLLVLLLLPVTAVAELGPWVDARTYGAVCNGITDDTTAFQAAIVATPQILAPSGICVITSTLYQNTYGPLAFTLPGLHIKGSGFGQTIFANRVANGDMIAVNPAWEAVSYALSTMTATPADGELGIPVDPTRYYVQITATDVNNGQEVLVNSSARAAPDVTGPNGSISVTLPSIPGNAFTYNIYVGTASTPVNRAIVVVDGVSVDAVGIAGGQKVVITTIDSSPVTIPTTPRAAWAQSVFSDFTILGEGTPLPTKSSGILLFRSAYAQVLNVHMKDLTGSGLRMPTHLGDSDGSFVTTIDNVRFENIQGWCFDGAGAALEFSNTSVTNTSFQRCGTLEKGHETTITAITKGNPGKVTTAGHGLQIDDQVYISGIKGMALPDGFYYVGEQDPQDEDTFTLRDNDGEPLDTINLGVHTPNSGTVQYKWRLPTSGGMQWKGLIGNFRNLGFTESRNVALYVPPTGMSVAMTMEGIDFENTTGKNLVLGAGRVITLRNSECLATVDPFAAISCVTIGVPGATSTVANVTIDGIKVRVDRDPFIAFESHAAYVAGLGLHLVDANTVSVSNISWQKFPDTATAFRFFGVTFPPITVTAHMTVPSKDLIALLPSAMGGQIPLRTTAKGEWLARQVPTAGWTLDTSDTNNTGGVPLTNDMTYCVYLSNTPPPQLILHPVPTLSVSTDCAYVVDPASGYPVKSDAPQSLLVGMVRSGPEDAMAPGKGHVLPTAGYSRSFWSRLPKVSSDRLEAIASRTQAAGQGEIAKGLRVPFWVPFMAWADDMVSVEVMGSVSNSKAGNRTRTQIAIDGDARDVGQTAAEPIGSIDGDVSPLGLVYGTNVRQGWHYASVFGAASADTSYWLGSTTAGQRLTIRVTVLPPGR